MKTKLLFLLFVLPLSFIANSQGCGSPFTDTGGATGNYSDNENYVITICPDNPGEQVTVTFSQFQTEAFWDALYVFDGSSVNSPQIASANGSGNVPGGLEGGFWGSELPGPFESSSPDGCLTFQFRSDISLQLTGWIANVVCAPPPLCPKPVALNLSNITWNSAVLSWTNVGTATSWEVLAQPCGTPAPSASTSGTTANATLYTFADLTPNTCYNFYVRANCTDGVSDWTPAVTGTTQFAPPTCGGSFLDNGFTSNYLANSNTVTTICPSEPGESVQVTFAEFNVEAAYDGLYVFNGNSSASPQIASTNGSGNVPGGLAGAFWGAAIPGPFQSTSPDGCLTFVFRSDTTSQYSGWIANVTCGQPVVCEIPTNVTVTNIVSSSATINWDATEGALEWFITITPGPTLTVTENAYTFTGLNAETTYSIMISATCALGFTSPTATASFTTATPVTNPLAVNSTLYTPEQLVNSVLINNPCLEISNVTSSTGTDFGSVNGIGFFENTNTTFPLTSGIVLSTGNAANIPGPNLSGLSDGTLQWLGDDDLEAIISATLGAPMDSYNATKLEFDFTALNEFMSFNFLFASDEYGTFQCNYADAFAFLLTDLTTGITTNLAVVPGTSDPVSVVTIRDDAFNDDCTSVNEGYFDHYFDVTNYDSATNFIGQTTVLTASSALVQGNPYHIKLVVADRTDAAYDSAVFIEAGSFTIGPPQCTDKLELIAFVDENNNGVKDNGEDAFDHGSFTIDQNNSGTASQVYSPFGVYSLYDENPANVYDLGFDLQPEFGAYYSASASYDDVAIVSGNGTQILYFPIVLMQAYNDVTVTIVPLAAPRPGMSYTNKVVYKNLGVTAASGTLTFVNDALVAIASITQSGTVPTANGFTYAFLDLQPNETRSFFVEMNVPALPTVEIDDTLTNTATISAPANDINVANNSFENTEIVVGSYDPNKVTEAHGEEINIETFGANDYLYYTVHFQNTGTASAITVLIEDTLDAQLDEESIVMLNASHNYVMTREGNHLTWTFDYIMLPGQLENEELSKGYALFKIKMKPGFEAGDIVPNAADIYFDTNPAVTTETFHTEFLAPLAVSEFGNGNLILFPNPAQSSFTVSVKNTSDLLSSVIVTDMVGKIVRNEETDAAPQVNVDVSGLSVGMYLVEILTENNQRVVKKLVIR